MPDLAFAAPAGLAAFLALPIILWLHLRRRRPRRILVPSLAPWLVLVPAAPPRRRRIPPTLLLALHLSAATALALALARPTLGRGAAAAVDRAVILDLTTSMGAEGRWPEALVRARALLDGTRGAATLVTLEPRPRVLVARAVDGRSAQEALDRLAPGGSGAATDEALAMAAAVAGPEAELVVVSDGGAPPPGPAAPAARWEQVGRATDNLAILTAAARAAGGETRLFARLASFAGAPAEAPLLLRVDGRDWDQQQVRLAPGASFETVWTLPPGARTAELELRAGDALPADDRAVVPLDPVGPRIQLVGDSAVLRRALAALPDASLGRAGLGDFRADGSVDLSVFAGALPERLPPGGVLVFDAPPGRLFAGQAGGGSARLGPAGAHPLVAGLDLAGATLADVAAVALPDWAEPVMVDEEGRPLVFAGSFGDSRIVVFAFDPDAGDLARRLAFPLLLARAADWAAPALPADTLAAGAGLALPAAELYVRLPDGRERRATGFFDDTRQPGLYQVRPLVAEGGGRRFAVHAGDPRESDLRGMRIEAGAGDRSAGERDPSGFGESPAPGGQTLGSLGDASAPASRVERWPWLAAIALAIVLAEGVWRASGRGAASRDSGIRADASDQGGAG